MSADRPNPPSGPPSGASDPYRGTFSDPDVPRRPYPAQGVGHFGRPDTDPVGPQPPATSWAAAIAAVVVALCSAYAAWQSGRNGDKIAETRQAADAASVHAQAATSVAATAAAEAQAAKVEAQQTHARVKAMTAPKPQE